MAREEARHKPAGPLAEGYERLRDGVVSGTALLSRRWGWNLLLKRGLAAWIHAGSDEGASGTANVSETPERVVSSSPPEAVSLPEPLPQQMTSALVEMILQQAAVSAESR